MNISHPRLPHIVAIPAGAAGITVLESALHDALADPALVIAPVPEESAHITAELRGALLSAIEPAVPIADAKVQVILATSGSTGSPKGVMHSMAAIRHSADALHARLGGPGNWTCALPLHTSAGFMTVARTVVAGTRPIGTANLGAAAPFTADIFIQSAEAALLAAGRHYISLVPQQAQRLLDSPAALELLARYDCVLLGGQAISDDLSGKLREAGVTIALSYGSTETCGGCVYDGVPLDGVSLRIEDGAVVVSGPCVMAGYRDSSGESGRGLNADGSFTMPDFGEIVDGVLAVGGRLDDVIIVKGVNVSPTHIESMLRRLGVDAVVLADRSTETLVAAVEVAPPADAAEAIASVRRHLGLPLRLRHVAQIPLSASGKPDLVALHNMVCVRH